MKHKKRWIVGLACAVFVALLPSSVVIVDGGELAEQEAAKTFDPVAYVDEIWESRILPTFEEDAQDLATVLNAIEVDANGNGDKSQLAAVTEEYGTVTVGEAFIFLFRGAGTVTEVSPLGRATIAVDGYDGPIEIELYVGGRVPSDETSVRDGVGFIDFGDFKTQTEFGQVAAEINGRVLNEVLAPFADEDLTGSEISFLASISIRTFNLVQIDLSSMKLLPVKITKEG